MEHMRMAIYTLKPGVNVDEVVGEARRGLLPIFQRQSGFLSYEIVGLGGAIASISRWKTREAAEMATESAADFVRKVLSEKLSLERNLIGGVELSASSAGARSATPGERPARA